MSKEEQIGVPALLGHPTKSEGPQRHNATLKDEMTPGVPLSGLRGLLNVKSGCAALTREEEGQGELTTSTETASAGTAGR
jgi:hypothetical protein